MKFNEELDIMDSEHLIDGGYENDDVFLGEQEDYAEIEMEVAEPTKITDIDGSVVIATPGDIVTIKSESIKRFGKIKEVFEDDEDDGIPKNALNYKKGY